MKVIVGDYALEVVESDAFPFKITHKDGRKTAISQAALTAQLDVLFEPLKTSVSHSRLNR